MAEQATSGSAVGRSDPPVEYGRYYYRHDCGVPYERNSYWLEFFGKVADNIVRDLRPAKVLDAGCAMGFLVEALRERGVDAWGIDVSEYAISQVHESVQDYCEIRSLAEPIAGSYDLIVSIEVLEHIPPAETSAAIANICAATERLLLSTTPDDYGEATHLNVQPPEAWSAMLAQEGFVRDVERDVTYLTPWAGLYVRTGEPLPEVVRRYDRTWTRQRREADQLRDALLAAQERMAELEDVPGGSRPELLAKIESQQEEILRLRDLLVGKEAELGGAKGRLAELEDRALRLANVKRRVESKVPVFGKLAGLVLRLLRGR